MSASTEQNRSLLLALKVLLLVALANSLYVFSTGWSHPFFDLHPFRQFQTALSITNIVQGGPWFAYETPLFGPPWSIPFELPVYQWITALLIHLTDLSMEHASRLVSVTFFYASLYFCYTTLRLWQCSLLHRLCFVILMLFSPIYLFWSRTCMIESVSLFLCLAYVNFGSRYLVRSRTIVWLVLASVFGAVAAMTKGTTFFAFCLLLGLLTLRTVWRRDEALAATLRANWRALLGILIGCCVLPLLAAKGWVSFGDELKAQAPLAAWLTSEQLVAWNFGTLAQRLSADFWIGTIPNTMTRSLGHVFFLPVAVLLAVVLKLRLLPVLIGIGLYLAVTLTFIGLHIVHDYYAYASAIFLVFALSYVLGNALGDSRRVLSGAALFCLIGIFAWNLHEYRGSYLQLQKYEARPGPVIEAARRLIPEDEVALIYGADWSSEIAYQIARKVIMDRDRRSVDDPIMAASLRQLGDWKIGAVLNCGGGRRITRQATFAQTLQRLAMNPQPVLTHVTRWPPSGLVCELFTPAVRSASQ